jgi:hypothetical protein
MLPTVTSELDELVSKTSNFFYNKEYKFSNIGTLEDGVVGIRKLNESISGNISSGNIFLDYAVAIFRNPALDFSYKNSISMHYDTLDKFWDYRPSTSGWLSSDVSGISPISGSSITDFLSTNKKTINGYSNMVFGGVFNFFFKMTKPFVSVSPYIYFNLANKAAFEFGNGVNFINNSFVFLGNKSEKKKNLFKLVRGNEYLHLLKLRDNGTYTNDQLSIIKNLNAGRIWAENGYFITDDYEAPMYLELFGRKLELNREELISTSVTHLVDSKVSKKYCLDLLQYYDIYFGKKKVKVNELTLDVLYGNGILETEEYLLKIIRFSPEIFICVGAIASLKDWGYSPAGVFKMINLFLDSDRI